MSSSGRREQKSEVSYKVMLHDSVMSSREKKEKPDQRVKVIFPISMELTEENGIHSGEKLFAQLAHLKNQNCQVTILLADELQIHNRCLPEATKEQREEKRKEARQRGDKILREHADQSSTLTQEDLDKNAPITIQGCKVIRWGAYLAEHKDDISKMRQVIDAHSKDGSLLLKLMKGAHSKLKNKEVTVAQSLALLREEFSLILSLKEFDYLVYPNPTAAMSFLFMPQEFQKDLDNNPIIKPSFNRIRVVEVDSKLEQSKKEKPKKSANLKNAAARVVHRNLSSGVADAADLLHSPQIKEDEKNCFREHLQEIKDLLDSLLKLDPKERVKLATQSPKGSALVTFSLIAGSSPKAASLLNALSPHRTRSSSGTSCALEQRTNIHSDEVELPLTSPKLTRVTSG